MFAHSGWEGLVRVRGRYSLLMSKVKGFTHGENLGRATPRISDALALSYVAGDGNVRFRDLWVFGLMSESRQR
jgi:hypothetical protein